MKRSANICFLILLWLILLAPLVQMLTHVVPVPQLEERRELHTVHDMPQRAIMLDATLADDINSWFNDHYGFRDILVRTKHEADYQLFGVSDKVLIGDNGWLFDSNVIKTILNNNQGNAQYYALLAKGVDDLNSCLAQRGVKLVVVYNPTKQTIYPEHLPHWAMRDTQRGLAQQLAEHFEQEKDLLFINGETLARNHKNEYLFYRTDMHMAPKGSQLVYDEMSRKMAQWANIPLPKLRDLTFVNTYWDHGGEERFLSKFYPIGEMLTGPLNPAAVLKDDANGHWTENIGKGPVEGYPDLPIFDFSFENLRRNTPLLPVMVMAGSSFTDMFFALGYHEAFKAVYKTKDNVATRLIPMLHNLPVGTRFFVIEYPEMFTMGLTTLPQANPCNDARASL